MKIAVHNGHFSSQAQIWDELEVSGLYPVEMNVPAVKNESHWHRFSTRIYIIEGELNITDTDRDRTLKAGPGARVDVPERTLHSEESASGYKIIAGMSVDPASLSGDIDLDPNLLDN
jgi:hypothetical protein